MHHAQYGASDSQTERRRFVRVQDAVGLHVQRLVDVPAAGQEAPSSPQPSVRKTDKYSMDGYATVRKDYPDVAQYISDLEERIRELLLDGDAAPAKPTHKVSLSAGGLSFSDKALFVPGEVVSVTLTLFPEAKRIGTDAVIVSANDTDELPNQNNPTYRAEFIRISDSDRQVIEEHVRQLLAKRSLLSD